MSARISKTQASRNKLQGLIREVEILKAQHLKALNAIQTDAEYQALEDQIARQSKLIDHLRVDVVKAQDGQIDVNAIAAGRVRIAETNAHATRRRAEDAEREVQNLREKIRRLDGKLYDYRVLTAIFTVASAIHLGVKYLPGLF